MPATVKLPLKKLRETFGPALQENAVLANYTTAHVGGAAAALVLVHTLEELERAARALWDLDVPFQLLGSGSNVLVSDAGCTEVVLVNRTRNIKIDVHHAPPGAWAESGANLGTLARQAALRGLSGLEWAATVPGTVGGAVYGNAGAHGGDMSGCLDLAEILHRIHGRETLPVEKLAYEYRSSALKREPGQSVILAARIRLKQDVQAEVQKRMDDFAASRRRTQPPGASIGSMFKNPPGDHAGRLIEAAGLKGARVGGAEISSVHANFFVNNAHACAADVYGLIQLARRTVQEKFAVRLELEVELLGDWPNHLED